MGGGDTCVKACFQAKRVTRQWAFRGLPLPTEDLYLHLSLSFVRTNSQYLGRLIGHRIRLLRVWKRCRCARENQHSLHFGATILVDPKGQAKASAAMSTPNRGPQLLGVNYFFAVLAFLTVALRVYVRAFLVRKFSADDAVMVVAMV